MIQFKLMHTFLFVIYLSYIFLGPKVEEDKGGELDQVISIPRLLTEEFNVNVF